MKTTRTLALAAVAALSLGAGSAMAQEAGQYYPDYQTQRLLSAPAPTVQMNAQPQSGSSDVDGVQSGADHTPTFILNHRLYDAGGVSG